MSGLLKGNSGHIVRPYPAHGQEDAGAPDAAAARRDAQLEALQRDNESLREALAEAKDLLPAREAAAREAGKRDALAAATRDEKARIEALRRGVAAAVQAWESRLAELDALAAALSRHALAKIFNDCERRSEAVVDAVARQVRHLRRHGIVAVRVSSKDFPDEAALEAAKNALSLGSAALIADDDIGAGECRIDLQLGSVDVGPRTQWEQLDTFLRGLREDEAE